MFCIHQSKLLFLSQYRISYLLVSNHHPPAICCSFFLCRYNFLDKSVGVSTLFDITSDSPADDASQLVETSRPLHIPGLEGLVIPSNTRGRILRVISENTVLVRWEYSLSGIIVLIIRLANKLYIGNNREAFVTLELLRRMVTFNKAVCFSLLNISHFFYVQESYVNGKMESDVR
jgi:nuclear pore complex protein Nup188